MKGDISVIQHLNKILGNELVAINQYFLHARMYQDWGLEKLGAHEYHESIDEMKHADKLIKRILFLEGLPNVQDLGKLHIGEHTKEMLECDLRIEKTGNPKRPDRIALSIRALTPAPGKEPVDAEALARATERKRPSEGIGSFGELLRETLDRARK